MRLFSRAITLGCTLLLQAPVSAGDGMPARLWSEEPADVSFFAVGRVAPLVTGHELQSGTADIRTGWWDREPATAPWTGHALELIVKYQQNPLRAARALALLHTAMHDALSQAAREQLQPAARSIALHRAAGLVLGYLYPQEPAGRFEGLGVAGASALARRRGVRPEEFEKALRAAERAAAAVMWRAAHDGAGRQWSVRHRPQDTAGRWRPTPPIFAHNPVEPLAGHWRTWVLRDGGELMPAAPPAIDSPEYRREVEEVLRVAERLSPEQKAIADRWHLGQGSVTPAGVWNRVALDLAAANGLDTQRGAEVFAALNAAMTDAFIACWRAKFAWWTERPVTAIRERLDPAFLPHLVTPAFPSYVSGHAAVSGAAEVVLRNYFPARSGWLREQAEEAALSRLLGGIHFRSDNEEGLELGRRIGERVVARMNPASPGQRAGTDAR